MKTKTFLAAMAIFSASCSLVMERYNNSDGDSDADLDSDNDSDADLDNDIDTDTDTNELVCGNGFGDCNDNPEDGCETDITDTTIHCGECNNNCNSLDNVNNVICGDSQCMIISCNNNFEDCDENSEDGCETNIQTNNAHCGECNNNCSDLSGVATASCEEGECVIEECEEDYFNNDENKENGCEYACEITAGAHEISDDIDNDCDGEIDRSDPPVLYISFDEPSGDTVLDSSGYGHHGTLHDTVYTSDSIFGRAMEFNGTGYVEIPDSNVLEGFAQATWMLWVYPSRVDILRMSIAKHRCYRFSSRNSGNEFDFQYATPSSGDGWASGLASGYTIEVNTWHLLVVTYNGYQLVYYVNGEQTSEKSTSGNIGAWGDSLYIGRDALSSERPFSGTIDEVAIYNRAWTPEEVSRYYSLLAPE